MKTAAESGSILFMQPASGRRRQWMQDTVKPSRWRYQFQVPLTNTVVDVMSSEPENRSTCVSNQSSEAG